ncbi:MAG: DHA2 family efflux MFS transporter permease subunit [Bifidobacterium sp.]|nr:DHA2 family efflux MFS transporter permease subunit [Bifidobacterium sp.]MCI1634600.1 DHA2 family efflux MFS transporter permease subunit [Bifidobacterium sp.]
MNITAATAQWLTTAYMLTMSVVIPMTGSVLDRFSTRTVFFTAMTLFISGTVLAIVAPSFAVLLCARVIQAGGSALMIPLLMTTVMTFIPVTKRGQMMGWISVVISVAPAIGPTISGLVLELLSWRWLFAIMAPVAVVTTIIAFFSLSNVSQARPAHFDMPSIMLSVLGFGGIVFGLSSIGESSEGDAPISPLVPLVIGAVALVMFVLRQLHLQRTDQALLDLRPFRHRGFAMPLVMVAITMSALFGTLILLPLFLQSVRGLSTLETGLVLLPGGVAQGAASLIVGRLYDRYGARPLVIPGTLVMLASLGSFAFLGRHTTVWLVVLFYAVLSLALAFVTTPLLTSSLGSLPSRLYSHGSAIANTVQQLAGAAGTALFVTALSLSSAAARAGGLAPMAAQEAGMRGALSLGAVLAIVPAIMSFFVDRPSSS